MLEDAPVVQRCKDVYVGIMESDGLEPVFVIVKFDEEVYGLGEDSQHARAFAKAILKCADMMDTKNKKVFAEKKKAKR